MAGRPSGQQKSTLMKGAVTVLFGFGCKFEHIQFNTSVFTLKEQNHLFPNCANYLPDCPEGDFVSGKNCSSMSKLSLEV